MTTLMERLPQEVKDRLRRLAVMAENIDWPAHVARREGWLIANREYHAQQRRQGRMEMEALLGALGLRPSLGSDALHDVLLTAIDLYLNTDTTEAHAQADKDGIQVDVSRCPLYERLSDPGWYGLTACGCVSRIRGWYDTLGVDATEELAQNRKWGDPVCRLIVRTQAGSR